MRNDVIWAIRDARGLTVEEKGILWAVESRGVAFGTVGTVAADCGMTVDRFYRRRKPLIAQGVLEATEQPGGTTKYRVNAEALASKYGSLENSKGRSMENPERGLPISQRGVSGKPRIKGEPKEHPQEDLEEDTYFSGGVEEQLSHPHLNDAPCFCLGEETCEDCEPASSCDLHFPQPLPCVYCANEAQQAERSGRYSEATLQGWHEDHLERDEGLDPFGEPLEETKVQRYNGRGSW